MSFKPAAAVFSALPIVQHRIAAGLMIGSALVAAMALSPKAMAEVGAAPPQAVQVMRVEVKPRTSTWSYAGVVRPRFQSDLGFRVGGKIVERSVDVGQKVEAGQAIARLDETDLRLALDAQRAELSAARIARTEAAAAEDRFRTLQQQGHVAKAALDQRVSAAAEALSRVERAERSVALAENQLEYATLKADRAGIVIVLPAEAGQVVAAGQTVARVARLDAIEAEVVIPEHMLEAVRSAHANVELWGNGGHKLAARLREVSPEADSATRSYRARFSIETDGAMPELGRTATVHLETGGGPSVVSLPLSAVTNDGKGALVWVLSPDRRGVVRTPIEITSYGSAEVLVGSGLSSGDLVVTLGVHMLDPAKPVRVIEQRTVLR